MLSLLTCGRILSKVSFLACQTSTKQAVICRAAIYTGGHLSCTVCMLELSLFISDAGMCEPRTKKTKVQRELNNPWPRGVAWPNSISIAVVYALL